MIPDQMGEMKARRIDQLFEIAWPQDKEMELELRELINDGGALLCVLAILERFESILCDRAVIATPDGQLHDAMADALRPFVTAGLRACVDLAVLLAAMPVFGNANEVPAARDRLKLMQEISKIGNPE